MDADEITGRDGRLANALGNALQYAANEAIIFAALEEFFSPKPAQLAEGVIQQEALNEQVHRVTMLYGDAPKIIFQAENEPKPLFDTYLFASINEALETFHRARRSLCRAQTFMIGEHMLRTNPELLNIPEDEKVRELFQKNAEDVFWEHAETTFIRLASYWDRLGQILDFAFFSIRQYERDGFSAVVDRIRANPLRMRPELAETDAWLAIWTYKRLAGEGGLDWLLSRRNLLVHSLHLGSSRDTANDEIFISAFNHLDERVREKLKPGDPKVEIGRLHVHLAQAAALLPQVLTLCELQKKT